MPNELPYEEPLEWSSFIQAYAAGKWDPRHTPKPPRSQHFPGTAFNEVGRLEDVSRTPTFLRSAISTSDGTVTPRKCTPGTSSSSTLSSKLSLGTPGNGGELGSPSTASSSLVSTSHSFLVPVHTSVLSSHMTLKMRREQNHHGSDSSSGSGTPSQPLPKLTMPPLPRGILSRSLSDSSSVSPAPIDDTSKLSTHESHHDFHAAAATMRLAGDGINVRPLALPSPEVELTDPLRGHTASLGLPWPREGQDPKIGDPTASSITSSDSGSHSRKTRLNSFWNVLDDVMGSPTQDILETNGASLAVQNGHPSGLPSILASSDDAPSESMGPGSGPSFNGDYPIPPHIPPASAPLLSGPRKPSPDDYFAIPPRLKEKSAVTDAPEYPALLDKKLLPSIQYLPVFEISPESLTSSEGSFRPPLFNRTVSEPVAPSIKPAGGSPVDPTPDNEPLCPRPQSEIIKPSHRRAREEVEYLQRGYLVPPTPPNEWERQKALYKFVPLLFI